MAENTKEGMGLFDIVTTDDIEKWEHETEMRGGLFRVKWACRLKGTSKGLYTWQESPSSFAHARNIASRVLFDEAFYSFKQLNDSITRDNLIDHIEPIPKTSEQPDDEPEAPDRIGVLLSDCDGNDAIILTDSVNGICQVNGEANVIFSGVTVGVRGTVIEVARKLGIYVEDARDMPGDAEPENGKGEVAE